MLRVMNANDGQLCNEANDTHLKVDQLKKQLSVHDPISKKPNAIKIFSFEHLFSHESPQV